MALVNKKKTVIAQLFFLFLKKKPVKNYAIVSHCK